MTTLKKNFMYQTLFQILSMILPLITSPLLARNLGPEGIGTYSYVTTVVSYFILIANMGIYKYGVREIAAARNDKNKMNKTFWEIWYLHVFISLIVGIIYLLLSIFIFKYKLYFTICIFSYLGAMLNINWLFTGVEDFKKVAIRDMVVKIISFLLIVFFVRGENALLKYFILMVACNFFSSFIYWFMIKKYISMEKISFKNMTHHFIGLLILSIPVLLESLYASMDKVMLGNMSTKAEVGFYENAEKALIAKTIIYSITIVLMPKMTNLLSNKDKKNFDILMKKSTNISMILTAAFSFGTAAVAKEFALLFWGEKFAKSINLIIVLSMAIPGIILAREIREQYLIPASKDKEYILSAGVGAVVNLIINFLLIPYYGALGAAIATLISEYFVIAVQMLTIRNELPMLKYLKGCEMYFIFGIVMLICVRLLGNNLGVHLYTLFLEIIFGAFIFGILCTIYWKITNNDYYFKLLSNTLKRFKKQKNK